MPKILLFLGSDDPEGEWYPFYREPTNSGIYEDAQKGEFITLCNNVSSTGNSPIPIQVAIHRIARNERNDTKSIYMRAKSLKELNSIVQCDDRWKNVLEGNP